VSKLSCPQASIRCSHVVTASATEIAEVGRAAAIVRASS